MEKSELFDRFIHLFAESTSTLTKEERRNLILNEIMVNFKCVPGFDEKQAKEITDGIVELVEKELAPICFNGIVTSDNSGGSIEIKYKIPYSAKDGFMYISSTDKLHMGDKCMITVKKI